MFHFRRHLRRLLSSVVTDGRQLRRRNVKPFQKQHHVIDATAQRTAGPWSNFQSKIHKNELFSDHQPFSLIV